MISILAIDPGSRRLGWANIRDSGEPEVHHCGAVEVDGIDGAAAQVEHLLAGLEVHRVVVEIPGGWMRGAKAKRSIAAVATLYQVIGAVRGLAVARSLPVLAIPDDAVKLGIGGHRSAAKQDVHRVLRMMGIRVPQVGRQTCAECRSAGEPDDHSPDASDAVALGLYAARTA